MHPLQHKMNSQTYEIEVSGIRAFDDRVSSIEGMIKLTIGEPDFATPEHIKTAAKQAIDNDLTHYPGMAGYIELRQGAADFIHNKYNVSYSAGSEVIVTVGATEALAASLMAILNPGDKILVPTPNFPAYDPLITLSRATPVYIDTSKNGFILTPEMIDTAMAEHGNDVKAIILNYPSNPTGVTYHREEIKKIASAVEKYNIFVISDEIYSELTYGEDHVSIAEYIKEQTILINGLSKSHAMTGWRIGFIFAPNELAAQIIKVHQYLVTSATSISQAAGIEALVNGADDAIPMREQYQKRRDFVYESMKNLGFDIARPNGAFYIFAKIPEGYIQNSMNFCVDLAEKNKVALIPGSAFGLGGEGYVRLSYAASMENLEMAMERLADYMAQNQPTDKQERTGTEQ